MYDYRNSLFNLNNILLKENVVYFKILNLYAVSSEKIHEICTVHKDVNTTGMEREEAS
jgi:hypothetical protein